MTATLAPPLSILTVSPALACPPSFLIVPPTAPLSGPGSLLALAPTLAPLGPLRQPGANQAEFPGGSPPMAAATEQVLGMLTVMDLGDPWFNPITRTNDRVGNHN